jgi:predicted nucleic acid-binding protein
VSTIVVADTSVLINFLRIDRMDLIGAYPASFVATDHVADEIVDAFPSQKARYHAALDAGQLSQQRVDDPAEIEIFLRLAERGRLGAGERSAIAVALNRGHLLAIDDSRAIRRAIEEAGLRKALTTARTKDIMVELIKRKAISVSDADEILRDWASNHRFQLKIVSFGDLM